jgi:hypothetical protein
MVNAMKHHPKRIHREKETLALMVGIYCRKVHKNSPEDCPECRDLLAYANDRLANCPWGENKPACSKCTIHCYSPEYRRRIKDVMRFAGPRMIFTHPVHAIRHLLHQFHH